MTYFLYLILVLGCLNLVRLAIFMVASNLHEISEAHDKMKEIQPRAKHPWVSVVIPAYNEALSIESTVKSVMANNYPHFEILVVDDGSADSTAKIVRRVMREYPDARLKLIRQINSGKSHALNNAIINHARGSLVMCLDADSMIAADGIRNAVQHFQRSPRLVALASNMKIRNGNSVLGAAQQVEYIVGNRFKRSLSFLNIEYIIGGIGSTFRKTYLKRVGYYDTDTMTEDIDLTMKILRLLGNKRYKVGYGYDVHTYTQAVPDLGGLLKQRFRWKYGRMQTLYKNREMLMSNNKKNSRMLTMFQLPYAIYSDVSLILEPLFAAYIFGSLLFGNPGIINWGVLFMGAYVGYIVLTSNDDNLGLLQKLRLLAISPFSWVLFYIITFVDFFAFMKCIPRIRSLPVALRSGTAQWEHVQRV